jgi:hypothetical protein
MDADRFDTLVRTLFIARSRRTALAVSGAALTGVGLLTVPSLHEAGAKGGKKKGKKKIPICVCQSADATSCTGQTKPKTKAKKILKQNPCAYKGKCQASVSGCVAPPLTVSAPFSVEAHWTNASSDHDADLFVPQAGFTTDPSPYISVNCTPANTKCEENLYPFACMSGNALGPGDEVTTVRKLLAGAYEYWIELDEGAPAGELTINLKNTGGSVLASWSSPANPSVTIELGWHVFNIDGSTGIVTSVDQRIDDFVFSGAHDPSFNVCAN